MQHCAWSFLTRDAGPGAASTRWTRWSKTTSGSSPSPRRVRPMRRSASAKTHPRTFATTAIVSCGRCSSHLGWTRRSSAGAPMPITITLNGEPFSLDHAATIAELLLTLQIDARRVAVEHNFLVLKRDRYADTAIGEGDQIEIVNFVGGGIG